MKSLLEGFFYFPSTPKGKIKVMKAEGRKEGKRMKIVERKSANKNLGGDKKK